MAFQQGLSGLNAASKALDVTSNNVANSATVGFKAAQAHFADVFAASLSGGGSAAVGIGTSLGGIQQQFTQGNITATNNPLDISINGGGFFRMEDSGTVTYSRAGQFHLDKDGFVVDDRSRQLTGFPVSGGTIVQSAPEPLQLSSASQDPVATGASVGGSFAGVKASLNLDSRALVKTTGFAFTPSASGIGGTIDSQSYNFSTATSIYDSLGNAHTLTMYAVKTTLSPAEGVVAIDAATVAKTTADDNVTTAAAAVPPDPVLIASTVADAAAATAALAAVTVAYTTAAADSQWLIYTSVDATNPGHVAGNPAVIAFDSSGNLVKPAPPNGVLDLSIDLDGVMEAQGKTNIATTPLKFTLDFAGTTQFGAASGTNSMQQDGFTSGRLTGVSIGADGIVRGNYSNGQAKDLGQVVLANFTNPNGLTSLGGNQWAETSASGAALVGAPDTGTLGVLQSAAIEESNVDLTAELVNMITQQRNYQANAQSIKTQDQLMQTLVNLR